MTQQTLTESLTQNEETLVSVSDERLRSLHHEFTTLKTPTHEDLRFDADAWREFITGCSQYEAKRLREVNDYSTTRETILSGIEFYHGDETAFDDVFSIVYENDNGYEWLDEKATRFIKEFGRRFVFAPLLCSWIPTIYICDEEAYYNRVNASSSGYYHPTEHWIAIKYDSGDPTTEYWSVTRDVPRQYESSTTLHELGHATHYLFSAQTDGSETVDNSDRTSENAVLSYKNINREEWQETFCKTARDGYFDLLDGSVSEVRLWKQKQTVEEYLAEGFCAYLTAPRWVAEEQPQLYKAFDAVCSP